MNQCVCGHARKDHIAGIGCIGKLGEGFIADFIGISGHSNQKCHCTKFRRPT